MASENQSEQKTAVVSPSGAFSASNADTGETPFKIVKNPEQDVNSEVQQISLSSFDIMSLGRSVPMTWFFTQESQAEDSMPSILQLCESLEKTLCQLYSVLMGRYGVPEIDNGPPLTVNLNNEGVPVYDGGVLEGADVDAALESHEMPCFLRSVHEMFTPPKAGMDPDTGSPDAPIMAVKITKVKSTKHGLITAVSLLAQHGVIDGDGLFTFMRIWSQIHKQITDNLPETELADGPVINDRIGRLVNFGSATGLMEDEAKLQLIKDNKPEGMPIDVVEPGFMPGFMQHMAKIAGQSVSLVPCDKGRIAQWKDAAVQSFGDQIPPTPANCPFHFSSDDILCVKVWRAMARARCTQLGFDMESEELTSSLFRAVNIRNRTVPPLGPNYCGNAVTDSKSELTIQQLLGSTGRLSDAQIAMKLREDLIVNSKMETTVERGQWLYVQHSQGKKTMRRFDDNALTFVCSSWAFDWESCDLGNGNKCIAYDHGALVPIVAVFVPRKGGDGMGVYVSGTEESCLGIRNELLI